MVVILCGAGIMEMEDDVGDAAAVMAGCWLDVAVDEEIGCSGVVKMVLLVEEEDDGC